MAAIPSTKVYSGTLREIFTTGVIDDGDTCTILTGIQLPFEAMLSLTKVNAYIVSPGDVHLVPVPTATVTRDTTGVLKIVLGNSSGAGAGNDYTATVEAYVYHTRIAYPDLTNTTAHLTKFYPVTSVEQISVAP